MYILSIVVPIYKAEKYIQECITSLLLQIPSNVEIVCVNDGTPDNSIAILENMISLQSESIQRQFRIIHQKNQGLSVARNTGIENASGEYIGFLDSDDKLLPQYFDNILPYLDGTYDIIDFNLIDSNGKVYQTSDGTINTAFSLLNWYSPGRVFKSESFINCKFIPNIHYEDMELTPKLYLASKRIKHIDHSLYYYRVNNEGITKSTSDENVLKTLESLEYIFNEYINLFRSTGNYHYALIALQSYNLLCFNAYLKFGIQKSFKLIDKYKFEFDLIKPNKLPIAKKWFSFKYRAFYYNPKAYLFAHKTNKSLKGIKLLK